MAGQSAASDGGGGSDGSGGQGGLRADCEEMEHLLATARPRINAELNPWLSTLKSRLHELSNNKQPFLHAQRPPTSGEPPTQVAVAVGKRARKDSGEEGGDEAAEEKQEAQAQDEVAPAQAAQVVGKRARKDSEKGGGDEAAEEEEEAHKQEEEAPTQAGSGKEGGDEAAEEGEEVQEQGDETAAAAEEEGEGGEAAEEGEEEPAAAAEEGGEEDEEEANIEELIPQLRNLEAQLRAAIGGDDFLGATSIKTKRDQVRRQLEKHACCVCYVAVPSPQARKLVQEKWYRDGTTSCKSQPGTWTCAYCKSQNATANADVRRELSLKLRASKELQQLCDDHLGGMSAKDRKVIQQAARMAVPRDGKGPRRRAGIAFQHFAWCGQLVRLEKRLRLEPQMRSEQVALELGLRHIGFW